MNLFMKSFQKVIKKSRIAATDWMRIAVHIELHPCGGPRGQGHHLGCPEEPHGKAHEEGDDQREERPEGGPQHRRRQQRQGGNLRDDGGDRAGCGRARKRHLATFGVVEEPVAHPRERWDAIQYT